MPYYDEKKALIGTPVAPNPIGGVGQNLNYMPTYGEGGMDPSLQNGEAGLISRAMGQRRDPNRWHRAYGNLAQIPAVPPVQEVASQAVAPQAPALAPVPPVMQPDRPEVDHAPDPRRALMMARLAEQGDAVRNTFNTRPMIRGEANPLMGTLPAMNRVTPEQQALLQQANANAYRNPGVLRRAAMRRPLIRGAMDSIPKPTGA